MDLGLSIEKLEIKGQGYTIFFSNILWCAKEKTNDQTYVHPILHNSVSGSRCTICGKTGKT